MKKLYQLFYLALWFFRARVLGVHIPLQSVVFATGGCDESCRHCTKCAFPQGRMKPYDEMVRDLRRCYDSGARILDIEGVDLLRWHDGDRDASALFEAARKTGFYNISTMIPARDWNGWSRLETGEDVLWVSIRGVDDLPLLLTDRSASLYMVVNSRNYDQIPDVLAFMKSHGNITQIAFNFHTPFEDTDDLTLSSELRARVVSQLIEFKKHGYRIMNTVSGLRNMLTLDFKRYCWVCGFVYCDGRQSPVCIDDESAGVCARCGFCMSGEMNAVMRFRPDTILAGLRSRT